MQTYYYFQSGPDTRLHAFTDDASGEKLPAEKKPWTFVRQVSPGEEWTFSTLKSVVAAGVLENGFLLQLEDKATSSKPVIESDRVEGTAVYDPHGKHIGTIKRLIIEKLSGHVVYADMTFGGFLGLGAHHHTIPWDKLSYEPRLGGYRTEITEEQVRGAPAFYDDGEVWPDRKSEQATQDYWRLPPYLSVL